MELLHVKYDRQEQVVVWVFRAILAALTLFAILFILVPYYVSGLYLLSLTDIEWSNQWLTNTLADPSILPDTSGFLVLALWVCTGFPILGGLIARLALQWTDLSHTGRIAELLFLSLSLLTFVILWLAAGKLTAFWFD